VLTQYFTSANFLPQYNSSFGGDWIPCQNTMKPAILFGSPEGKKRELTELGTSNDAHQALRRAPGPPSEEAKRESDRKCKQTTFAGA